MLFIVPMFNLETYYTHQKFINVLVSCTVNILPTVNVVPTADVLVAYHTRSGGDLSKW